MAVRNLAAIENNGKMIEEARINELNLRNEDFFNRVNKIKSLSQKAIDAVDTIRALYKNGLGKMFLDWQESVKSTIGITYTDCGFCIGSSCDGKVSYKPYNGEIYFSWDNYGMCETYSTSKLHSARGNDYYVIGRVYSKDKQYNKNLTELATKLEPYIDALFALVDGLK